MSSSVHRAAMQHQQQRSSTSTPPPPPPPLPRANSSSRTSQPHHVAFDTQQQQQGELLTDSTSSGSSGGARLRPRNGAAAGRDEEAGIEKGAAAAGVDSSGKGRKRKAQITWRRVPKQLAWIPPVLKSWPKMKPLLRSALVAWICMLMMVISPIQRSLGNASFLVLVGVFIQPAELPLVAVIEREFFTLGLLLIGWAWSCLGIKLSTLARSSILPTTAAPVASIFTGAYLEAAPTVICGLFLCIGVSASLYLKVRFGPSPFLFASILSCISLDITLGYQPLFPYANYMLTTTILKPLALKAAINIFISIVFFPKSVNSKFVEVMCGILAPLSKATRGQIEQLEKGVLAEDFEWGMVRELVTKAESGILPLTAQARLLTRELSFGVASGKALAEFVGLTRALLSPMDGFAYYYRMVQADIKQDRFPMTPVASHLNTPAGSATHTPMPSRPATPTLSRRASEVKDGSEAKLQADTSNGASKAPTPNDVGERKSSEHHAHAHPHKLVGLLDALRSHSPAPSSTHSHSHSHHPHFPHLHLPHLSRPEAATSVGVWESLRYSAVETHIHRKSNDEYTARVTALVGESTRDLLNAQSDALEHVEYWLKNVNSERLALLRRWVVGGKVAQTKEKGKCTKDVIAELEATLESFKTKRLAVVEPFRASVEGSGAPDSRIPHRYLFQAYVHQFHTAQFTTRLLALLQAVAKVEEERDAAGGRFWLPSVPKLFTAEAWKATGEHDENGHDDEDPKDMGYPSLVTTLGAVRRRDPDALEPHGYVQALGSRLSKLLHALGKGNVLFCLKAAALTALLSLPGYLKSSAEFAYKNKAVWSVFMAQLTLARHRGEVVFGVFSRLVATLLGAAIGLVLWYIPGGWLDGGANSYAMMATVAVGFPIVMLGRLYHPGPPITAIITCVTVALILGYSQQNSHYPTFGFTGTGWDVAWRRFVGVLIGTLAAYVMILLPPSSSLRKHQRHSHAAIISELGQLYCQVIAYAAAPHTAQSTPVELMLRLQATRSKLRRLGALSATVAYEISLRGRWPAERYAKLAAVSMELSKLLSHAVTVSEHLGPEYSAALLRRTRLLDPLFLADCIAVLQMCATALATGEPLPQVTPVLLDRFLRDMGQSGFAMQNGDDAEDLGLPRVVTFETLRSEQYQSYAVGVSVAFGIVLRIDLLCLSVKALVGETFPAPVDATGRFAPKSSYRRDWYANRV